jgi:hypothetical protein
MPAQRITAPLNAVEPHQVTITAATTANETAGSVVMVVPDGTPNQVLRRALLLAADACRRDPNVFRG